MTYTIGTFGAGYPTVAASNGNLQFNTGTSSDGKAYVYALITESHTVKLSISQTGTDDGTRWDALYYYHGTTLSDITNVSLNTNDAVWPFTPPSMPTGWSAIPNYSYNSPYPYTTQSSIDVEAGNYFAIISISDSGGTTFFNVFGAPTENGTQSRVTNTINKFSNVQLFPEHTGFCVRLMKKIRSNEIVNINPKYNLYTTISKFNELN